jgi:hypothetical protein
VCSSGQALKPFGRSGIGGKDEKAFSVPGRKDHGCTRGGDK